MKDLTASSRLIRTAVFCCVVIISVIIRNVRGGVTDTHGIQTGAGQFKYTASFYTIYMFNRERFITNGIH